MAPSGAGQGQPVAWRRVAAASLAWLGLLFGLWIVFVGTTAWLELVAGACAAAVAASAQAAVVRQGVLRFRLRPRRLARAWRVPGQCVLELGVVLFVLVRCLARRSRSAGAFRTVPFDAGGDDAAGAGWRAFATVAATIPPNTIVAEIDRERQVVVVHDLHQGHARRSTVL